LASQELELRSKYPASPDAERSILGAILLDNPSAEETYGLPEEAFSLDSHRRIMRAIRDMLGAGIPVDITTLPERLDQRKETQAVGGVSYLASLTEGLPRRPSIAAYVRIVREKWMLRQIINVCQRTIVNAEDQGEDDPSDIVTAADHDLLAIVADSPAAEPSLEEQSDEEFERMRRQRNGDEVMAYSFGISKLDALVGGLVPREMTVLGGRPGQGKTGLTVQLIARHCSAGVPVHAFEIEMSSGGLLRRLWAIVAGVPFHKVRCPERQTDDDFSLLLGARREVARWPLTIHEASSLDAAQLVSLARMGARRRKTKIVIVDYLQKMRFSGKAEHRYLAVTDAAMQLTRLAKDENLAVLLLSSVSEKSGSNRNAAPTLQDFRASGDIAYEAHTALLIHRETNDETEKPEQDGVIIVAKARSDGTGGVRVHFSNSMLTFEGQS
jgi:replicative DNA helicase